MTQFSSRDVEAYKSEGRYRTAGQLSCLLGLPPYYGCHFGMRSSRDFAIHEFQQGWSEVDFAVRNLGRAA